MVETEKKYIELLVEVVAKKMVEVFEGLTIEDVQMYQIGYNNAVKEFAYNMNLEILAEDDALLDKITLYKIVSKTAEGMKVG
jgi:hypothetical protein